MEVQLHVAKLMGQVQLSEKDTQISMQQRRIEVKVNVIAFHVEPHSHGLLLHYKKFLGKYRCYCSSSNCKKPK